jgi:hypothetical protein
LRVELMREGAPVSVTQVMPATINTPFFDKARTKLGVKPVAPSPIYQPSIVVDAILFAAEHPERDLVVGGAARAVMTAQQLSPRLLDALLLRFGFGVHYTDEPKTEDAPDNLFDPVQGLDTVEGSFGHRAHPTSLYNRMELHPAVKRGRRWARRSGRWSSCAEGCRVGTRRRAPRPARELRLAAPLTRAPPAVPAAFRPSVRPYCHPERFG